METKPLGQVIFVALLAIATAATWYLGSVGWRYKIHQAVSAPDNFDSVAWDNHGATENIEFPGDGVRLRNISHDRSYAKYFQSFPSDIDNKKHYLRVFTSVTIEQLDSSDTMPGAGLMIWFMESSNNEVVEYHTIIPLRAANKGDTLTANVTLSIPDTSDSFYLVLLNRESTGTYLLNGYSLDIVKNSMIFLGCLMILVTFWCCLFATLIRNIYIKAGTSVAFIVLAVILATIIGVVTPERLDRLLGIELPNYIINTKELWEWLYKAGHFVLFFTISLIALCYRWKLEANLNLCVTALVLFAIATEGAQKFLTGRFSQWTDFLTDIAGIIAALFVVIAADYYRSKKKTGDNTAT